MSFLSNRSTTSASGSSSNDRQQQRRENNPATNNTGGGDGDGSSNNDNSNNNNSNNNNSNNNSGGEVDLLVAFDFQPPRERLSNLDDTSAYYLSLVNNLVATLDERIMESSRARQSDSRSRQGRAQREGGNELRLGRRRQRDQQHPQEDVSEASGGRRRVRYDNMTLEETRLRRRHEGQDNAGRRTWRPVPLDTEANRRNSVVLRRRLFNPEAEPAASPATAEPERRGRDVGTRLGERLRAARTPLGEQGPRQRERVMISSTPSHRIMWGMEDEDTEDSDAASDDNMVRTMDIEFGGSAADSGRPLRDQEEDGSDHNDDDNDDDPAGDLDLIEARRRELAAQVNASYAGLPTAIRQAREFVSRLGLAQAGVSTAAQILPDILAPGYLRVPLRVTESEMRSRLASMSAGSPWALPETSKDEGASGEEKLPVNSGVPVVYRPWATAKLKKGVPHVFNADKLGEDDPHYIHIPETSVSCRSAKNRELKFRVVETDSGHVQNCVVGNILTSNSSTYTSTSPRNVGIKLAFSPDEGERRSPLQWRRRNPQPQQKPPKFCVLEHITVHAAGAHAASPCSEMMVFVSNNDLPLNSLDKYHDCTFEDYERLVREIKAQPVGTPLPDPLPVAYFWLSQEFGYVQSQTLEVGRGCAYVYLKLLRSDSPFGNRDGNVISLRYIHLEGYYGPQSFPTVSLA